jgi:AcrR family transcriptional regulator
MVQTAPVPRPEANGPAADGRRREILAAASTLFRRQGLAATGMREIAGELGMTAGNLYYYFGGKEELLAFCQETTLDELLAEARRIAALDLPAREKVRRLIVAHVVTLNETYPGSLAHLEVETLGGERRAPLQRKRKRYERLLRALVEEGIAAGELEPREPRLVVLALLGALNWTVKWYSPRGAKSAAEVGAAFADLFLDGLRKATR